MVRRVERGHGEDPGDSAIHNKLVRSVEQIRREGRDSGLAVQDAEAEGGAAALTASPHFAERMGRRLVLRIHGGVLSRICSSLFLSVNPPPSPPGHVRRYLRRVESLDNEYRSAFTFE